MKFYVHDSITGERVSDARDSDEAAGRLCGSMNGYHSGGLYHVRDEMGRRDFQPDYGVEAVVPDSPVGPVYVQVPGTRWCINHGAPMIPGIYESGSYCMIATWGSPEEEHCVPVPLYIEAQDP